MKGGHSVRKTSLAISLCYLVITACSCASSYAPQIIYYNHKNIGLRAFSFDSLTCKLDSLKPSENKNLTKRKIVPISIFMEAHGDCYYILYLSANRKRFRPFVLRMSQGLGAIDFSGYITWYIKVKGRFENITISLYRIEETDLCKTRVMTLIKQFRRTYNVIKHKQF